MVANMTMTKRLTTPQTMQKDKSSFQSHWFISDTPPFPQYFFLDSQSSTLVMCPANMLKNCKAYRGRGAKPFAWLRAHFENRTQESELPYHISVFSARPRPQDTNVGPGTHPRISWQGDSKRSLNGNHLPAQVPCRLMPPQRWPPVRPCRHRSG
jgi:hypothetical protein